MPSEENPFPGMNPYLESAWDDVHTMLISYIHDALSPQLPRDLSVRAEERLAVAAGGADELQWRQADLAVVESWKEGSPPPWRLHEESTADAGTVDEPLIFMSEPSTERWLEIRDVAGRVITVIEVLSPTNKRSGWAEYRAKQRECILAGVSLVEIDLLRGGEHTVAIGRGKLPPAEGTRYVVCVARPQISLHRREVYLSSLRERLPTIRVPLRPSDADVPLALQPLLDRCYRMGRHWLSAYGWPLDPPLPPDEAAWAQERLRAAGFAQTA